MRGFLWLALGVFLFLAWAISYLLLHVAGMLIHLLLVFATVSIMFHAFFGKRAAPRQ